MTQHSTDGQTECDENGWNDAETSGFMNCPVKKNHENHSGNINQYESNICAKPRQREDKWMVVDGHYGWVVTFIGFIVFLFSGGVFYSGGIVIPELLLAFPDTSRVAGTLIASIEFASMNFLCKYIVLCYFHI